MHRIRDFFRSGSARREAVALDATSSTTIVDALRDRLRAQRHLARHRRTAVASAGVRRSHPARHRPAQPRRQRRRCCRGTLPPRWIRISARERGAFVEVEVADGGPGIDASVRDALFEPLATTKPAGMGLGLPISRTLILAHGGRLELASLHPTTFRFSLPTHGNLLQ